MECGLQGHAIAQCGGIYSVEPVIALNGFVTSIGVAWETVRQTATICPSGPQCAVLAMCRSGPRLAMWLSIRQCAVLTSNVPFWSTCRSGPSLSKAGNLYETPPRGACVYHRFIYILIYIVYNVYPAGYICQKVRYQLCRLQFVGRHFPPIKRVSGCVHGE